MVKKTPASDDLNWMQEWPLGEIGNFGKIARGLVIMAKNTLAHWRLAILAIVAILAKIARGLVITTTWQIFKLDAKSDPFR